MTDDVVADGVVVVPKGSRVVCSSRPGGDGRGARNCDSIRTPDGVLAFRGVAVGEEQRVGLRLLEHEVAAGTPFVV